MVLTVSFALSSVIGLYCHRRLADIGVSNPLELTSPSARLDASVGASGLHDFAVRKNAPSSEAPLASTASRPASVTIAIRPSVGRDGGDLNLIWVRRERKYFLKMGLDGERKSVSPRAHSEDCHLLIDALEKHLLLCDHDASLGP